MSSGVQIGRGVWRETHTVPKKQWLRLLKWIFKKPARMGLTLFYLDFIAVTLGLVTGYYLAVFLGIEGSKQFYEYFTVWSPFIFIYIFIIFINGGYRHCRSRRPDKELEIVVKSNLLTILLIVTLNFMSYKYIPFSRYVLILGFLFSLLLTVLAHFGFRSAFRKLWEYGIGKENLLVVGDCVQSINKFIDHLKVMRFWGFNILGYVEDQPVTHHELTIGYMGGFDSIREIQQTIRIDKALLAMKKAASPDIVHQRIDVLVGLKVPILVVSEIFNNYNFALTMDGYSGIFEVYRRSNNYLNPFWRFIKRTFDIIFTMIFLLPALPIGAILALLIKLHDGGPIFFQDRRPGRDGKSFVCLKFRSMAENAQDILKKSPELYGEFIKKHKISNDPRVTPIGRWLRRVSLDELPQLINILKGDMSLVGPRPVTGEKELELFGDFKHERMRVRPGLTGFWQISGRCNTTYDERIKMDKFYLYNCSIWLDLFILLKTPLKVLKGEGAH